jgi:hypothetical protein
MLPTLSRTDNRDCDGQSGEWDSFSRRMRVLIYISAILWLMICLLVIRLLG